MIKFKKTMIAAFILGGSSAFAGTMGPTCIPGNATVPCPSNGWDIGIQALYLQPLYSNTNLSAINIGSGTGTRIYEELDQDFDWGFRLEGGFRFSTGNDINVNWIRWHQDLENRLSPAPGTLAVPNNPTVLSIRFDTNYSSGTDFDSVNLEFGQHVNFGEFKTIRFHAGAQLARINATLISEYIVSGAPPELIDFNSSTRITEQMNFKGAGPRLGLDMQYNIANGFAVYGKGAVAALVGRNKYNNDAPFDNTVDNRSRPVRSSYMSLVPELDAKLGAAYAFELAQGNFTLDAGYMIVNYFNTLHQSDLNLNTVQETRLQSDFGLHGAYVGVKWVGIV